MDMWDAQGRMLAREQEKRVGEGTGPCCGDKKGGSVLQLARGTASTIRFHVGGSD